MTAKGLVTTLKVFCSKTFDIRVVYGVCGIVMSIVAHELFHILMHLDSIEYIELFPDGHAIVAITAAMTPGYNVNLEELIAYGITLTFLIITAIDVFAIHDSRDDKTLAHTLFARDDAMHDLDHPTFLELAARSKLI